MEERYFVEVGNCYVKFLGIWHEPKTPSDYHKAEPFMTEMKANEEAIKRVLRDSKL